MERFHVQYQALYLERTPSIKILLPELMACFNISSIFVIAALSIAIYFLYCLRISS